MTANDILKSLTEIQNSLEEIDSAKQQVKKIIESSAEFAETASTCNSTFEKLGSNISIMIEKINGLSLKTLADMEKQTQTLKGQLAYLNDFNKHFTIISRHLEIIQKAADERYEEIASRLEKLDHDFQQFSQREGIVDRFAKTFRRKT